MSLLTVFEFFLCHQMKTLNKTKAVNEIIKKWFVYLFIIKNGFHIILYTYYNA